MLVSQGPGGTNRARISDSAFSNCGGDGLFMYNAPFLGLPGASRELSLEIEHSTITTENGYGLRWANYGSIDLASVKVRHSFLTGALDKAAVALMQNPSGATYKAGAFDFGTEGAPGGNCIGLPGPRAVELVGVDGTFAGNFWGANLEVSSTGHPATPAFDTISMNGAKIDMGAALSTAPTICGRL